MTIEQKAIILGRLAARCNLRAERSQEPERTEWNRKAEQWRDKQADILSTAARQELISDVVSFFPTSRGIGFRDASHRCTTR